MTGNQLLQLLPRQILPNGLLELLLKGLLELLLKRLLELLLKRLLELLLKRLLELLLSTSSWLRPFSVINFIKIIIELLPDSASILRLNCLKDCLRISRIYWWAVALIPLGINPTRPYDRSLVSKLACMSNQPTRCL